MSSQSLGKRYGCPKTTPAATRPPSTTSVTKSFTPLRFFRRCGCWVRGTATDAASNSKCDVVAGGWTGAGTDGSSGPLGCAIGVASRMSGSASTAGVDASISGPDVTSPSAGTIAAGTAVRITGSSPESKAGATGSTAGAAAAAGAASSRRRRGVSGQAQAQQAQARPQRRQRAGAAAGAAAATSTGGGARSVGGQRRNRAGCGEIQGQRHQADRLDRLRRRRLDLRNRHVLGFRLRRRRGHGSRRCRFGDRLGIGRVDDRLPGQRGDTWSARAVRRSHAASSAR